MKLRAIKEEDKEKEKAMTNEVVQLSSERQSVSHQSQVTRDKEDGAYEQRNERCNCGTYGLPNVQMKGTYKWLYRFGAWILLAESPLSGNGNLGGIEGKKKPTVILHKASAAFLCPGSAQA
ncbi:uncharacterized protein M6G45_004784 [Spheniscus humboldti]